MSKSVITMRLACVLAAFFLSLPVARAQSHFSGCITRTGENSTIIVPTTATLNVGGATIQNGDEIAVFGSDGKCAGVGVWNGANLAISVWGADDLTKIGGLKAGDPLKFIIWDASNQAEYASTKAIYSSSKTYLRSDGIYASGAIYELASLNATLAAPILSAPVDNATQVPVSTTLSWQPVTGVTTYDIQMSTSSSFASITFGRASYSGTSIQVSGLSNATKYYWRIRPTKGSVAGDWSAPRAFTVIPILYKKQEIALNQGWNLISSNLQPRNVSMDSLFSSVSTGMVMVKDQEGNVYQPAASIRSLQTWAPTQGYRVYMEAPATLTITGTEIDPQKTPRTLTMGWNTVAYLRNSAMDITKALATLDTGMVVVKDLAGNLYIPQYGINELKTMNPGSGYMIYMLSSEVLTYPANATTTTTSSMQIVASIQSHSPNGIYSHVIVQAPELEGQTVSLWSGNHIVGTGQVSAGKAAVKLVGDDPLTTDVVEGAKNGDPLVIRIGTSLSGTEITPTAIQDVLSGHDAALQYHADAVLSVQTTGTATGIEAEQRTDFKLYQNFPNPSQQSTKIEYTLGEEDDVTLEVFNVLGQRVDQLVSARQAAGRYSITFDTSHLGNGTYIYRLRSGRNVETRKMIVAR